MSIYKRIFIAASIFLFTLSAQAGTNEMLDNLHWLGHASFRLDTHKIIYFDPWKIAPNSPKADLIFISHSHFDHYSLVDLRSICAKETIILSNEDVAGALSKEKLPAKEIKVLSVGEKIEMAGIQINAVAGYNINKPFHPEGSGNLGFIVSIDGVKIYHAGDTDFIPEMKTYQCDIALLPVSGTYVMTAKEASEAALVIQPKVVIPMHYGDIVGSTDDAQKLQDLLKGKIEVKILKKES